MTSHTPFPAMLDSKESNAPDLQRHCKILLQILQAPLEHRTLIALLMWCLEQHLAGCECMHLCLDEACDCGGNGDGSMDVDCIQLQSRLTSLVEEAIERSAFNASKK